LFDDFSSVLVFSKHLKLEKLALGKTVV
jgi:hypothetical protein